MKDLAIAIGNMILILLMVCIAAASISIMADTYLLSVPIGLFLIHLLKKTFPNGIEE